MEKFWRRDSLQSRRSRRKVGKMIEEKEGARGPYRACTASSRVCYFFPNSVSLGSSAIVKVPEQVGAAKSAGNRVPRKVPRKSFLFQENPSEQPDPHGARLGTGCEEEVPKQGCQEEVPKQGFQARFPGTGSQVRFPRGSKEQVPKQGFPARGFQARFPGSQARFPWKRFPARFPARNKEGSQARLAGTDSQARVPSKRVPSRVPRKRLPREEEVPRQGSQEVPSKAPRNRFPSKGFQARVPSKRFPSKGSFQARFSGRGSQVLQARVSETVLKVSGTVSQARFPGPCFSKQNKVPRTGFQTSVSGKRFPGRGAQVPSKLVPKQCFQEEVPKQGSQPQVPRNRCPYKVPRTGSQIRFPIAFPSKVPGKRFPSKDSQEQVLQARVSGIVLKVSGAVSQARFPGPCFSKQNKVPRTGFQTSVSGKRFPGRGAQARFPASWFPSNVFRKKFPSKVPSHGFPGTGARTRFPRTGSQIRFPIAFPSKVPGKRFPSKVPSNRFPGTGSQTSFPRTGSQVRFPEKVPKQCFQEKVLKQSSQEEVRKQGFPVAPGNYALEPA